MMDFTGNQLTARAITAQREREARAIMRAAEARETPRGVRAALATRLMCVAYHLHREAVRSLASREFRTAGRG